MYFLPGIIFVVINIILFSLLITAVNRASTSGIMILYVLIMIECIVSAFYTLHNYVGAFGPGGFLFYLSALVTLIMLMFVIIWSSILFPQLTKQRRIYYAFGAFLMVLSAVSPILGKVGIGSYCDEQAMEHGDKIVSAIRAYESDHGFFPERLGALNRDYFKDETSYSCMKKIGINLEIFTAEFRIEECEGHTSLVTTSMDGILVVWYDLVTNEWNTYDAFEGRC
jgi:hypothetical protein